MSQIFQLTPFGGVVLEGSGPPSAAVGVPGNLYIDRTNILLYGPKSSAGWGTGLNLRSPVRWENSVVYKGAIAHNAAAPTAPIAGDIYIFNSQGICSWVQNKRVHPTDVALYTGTEWQLLNWGNGEFYYMGSASPAQIEPPNPRPGDVFLFVDKGTNSWGTGTRLVNGGTLAIYSTEGWRFNRSAPEVALGSRGSQNASNAPSFTPELGDVVTFNASTVHTQWVTGWSSSQSPSINKPSIALYTSFGWVTLEPLLEPASESLFGKVRLAAQNEVNAGTDEEKVLTPKTFANYAPSTSLGNNQSRPAKIFQLSLNLTANSWANLVHNLNNPYPGVTVYHLNEVILLDIERVDNNTIRLRSAVNLTGVVVSVVG